MLCFGVLPYIFFNINNEKSRIPLLNATILFTLGKFYSSPSKRLRYEALVKNASSSWYLKIQRPLVILSYRSKISDDGLSSLRLRGSILSMFCSATMAAERSQFGYLYKNLTQVLQVSMLILLHLKVLDKFLLIQPSISFSSVINLL